MVKILQFRFEELFKSIIKYLEVVVMGNFIRVAWYEDIFVVYIYIFLLLD